MAKHVFIDPSKQIDVIRHSSKLETGNFYLMQETGGHWIMQVVADNPLIQARRFFLDGYEMGWVDGLIITLSFDFLQTYGVLPDPLQNFTLIDCVLPLNATDLQTAISHANERLQKIKSES